MQLCAINLLKKYINNSSKISSIEIFIYYLVFPVYLQRAVLVHNLHNISCTIVRDVRSTSRAG